jgi:hypothetical protein
MKEAPKNIFLQWDGETELSEGQITWCVDRINDSDVEYILATELEAAEKVIFEAGKLMGEKLLELTAVKEEVNRLTRLLMEVGERE